MENSESRHLYRQSGMLKLICKTSFLGKGEDKIHCHFYGQESLVLLLVSYNLQENSWKALRHRQPGRAHWTAYPVIYVLLISKSFTVFSDNSHRRESVYIMPDVLIIFSQEKNNLISKFTTRLPCQGTPELQAAFLDWTSGGTKRSLSWVSTTLRLSVICCGRQAICFTFLGLKFPWV